MEVPHNARPCRALRIICHLRSKLGRYDFVFPEFPKVKRDPIFGFLKGHLAPIPKPVEPHHASAVRNLHADADPGDRADPTAPCLRGDREW